MKDFPNPVGSRITGRQRHHQSLSVIPSCRSAGAEGAAVPEQQSGARLLLATRVGARGVQPPCSPLVTPEEGALQAG